MCTQWAKKGGAPSLLQQLIFSNSPCSPQTSAFGRLSGQPGCILPTSCSSQLPAGHRSPAYPMPCIGEQRLHWKVTSYLMERCRASSWFQQEKQGGGGEERGRNQTRKHPAPGCSKIMNFAANIRDSVESWKNARLHDHRNAESMGPRQRWLGQFTSLRLCFKLLAV